MDKITTNGFDFDHAAEQVCWSAPGYSTMTESERIAFRKQAIRYLKTLEHISLTFTLNQMRGTPSLILFDDTHKILFHHFGHIDFGVMKSHVEGFLNSYE